MFVKLIYEKVFRTKALIFFHIKTFLFNQVCSLSNILIFCFILNVTYNIFLVLFVLFMKPEHKIPQLKV